MTRCGAAFGALLLACVLASGCGPSLDDDMKVICEAGASGGVVGVGSVEGKTAALKQYLDINVKSDKGKAFANELLAAPAGEKVAKLEGGIKAAGIEPGRCATLKLLKQLPVPE